MIRLYAKSCQSRILDGKDSPYRNLTWSDVVTTDAWNISYEAAVEGIVILKNDGTLPLSKKIRSVSLIGPWANATKQLQGNYFGASVSHKSIGCPESFETRCDLRAWHQYSSFSTNGFADAVSAARKSDVIIYAGGIDNTIEAEGMDRQNITWPGNQLQLIEELSSLGKLSVCV